MDNTSPEKKQSMLKSLAIIGLLGTIVLMAWLAVQLVTVLPSALNSLASLANSVYNYSPSETRDLDLNTSKTMVNAGEETSLSWPTNSIVGTYTFKYECKDNISVSLSTEEKSFANLTCDEVYEIGQVDSIKLIINSSKERFTDVNYTVAFFRTNATKPTAAKNDTLTVVNQSLTLDNELITETEILPPTENTDTPVATSTTPEEPVVVVTKPVATTTPVKKEETPIVKATTTPATPTAKPTTPVYVYQVPVSDPNGFVDLQVTLVDYKVGERINLSKNTSTSIRFAIHNLGTKTSDPWSFSTAMPGDTNFTSGPQSPLKPNERAVMTVNFTTPANSTSKENISVEAFTKTDLNKKNNLINQVVSIN